MLYFIVALDLVVHNQSTKCFVILLCHNTFAKSYDSKVGLITQKRCILVTVFAALLLPILLYACYYLCCSLVTDFVVFFVTGYSVKTTDLPQKPTLNAVGGPQICKPTAVGRGRNKPCYRVKVFGKHKCTRKADTRRYRPKIFL